MSQKDVVVLFHKGSIFSQTSGRARPGLTDNRQETKGQQYNSNWEEKCSFVSQVQSQKISFDSKQHGRTLPFVVMYINETRYKVRTAS